MFNVLIGEDLLSLFNYTGDIVKGFGVGCFNIEFIKPLDYDKLSKDEKENILKSFESNLSKYLNKIENLSELEISGLEPGFCESFNREHEGCVPTSHMGDITFKLYIPKKVHPEFLRKLDVEYFKVHILFKYSVPVWFIFPITQNGDPFFTESPSISVAIVREYLKVKFSNLDVNFYTIGPSPFHCDFFYEKDEKLSFEIKRTEAYDEIIVKSPDEESLFICFDLGEQLDLYYNVMSIKLGLWDEQKKLDERLSHLIHYIEKNDFSLFVYWSRVILSKKLNIELLILKKNFDFNQREIEGELNKVVDDEALINWHNYMKEKVKANFAEFSIDIESYDRVLITSKELITRTFDFYKSIFVGIFLAVLGVVLTKISNERSVERCSTSKAEITLPTNSSSKIYTAEEKK